LRDLCFTPPNVILGLVEPGALEGVCAAIQNDEASATSTAFPVYVAVFAVNALLEAPAYGFAGYLNKQAPVAILRQILVLNIATHPAVFYLFPLLASRLGWTLLTLTGASEAFAIVVEAALLKLVWNFSWLAAAFASLAANLTSWWVGAYLMEAGFLG
jgi:hypothetical protein